MQDYIRKAAIARGVNPDYALRVTAGEGGFRPTHLQAGDENSSFGPFQFHYGHISRTFPHPGVGDAFTKATGLDARKASTLKQQIDFALNTIAEGGWGPWRGSSSHSFITGRMGISPNAHAIPITPGDGTISGGLPQVQPGYFAGQTGGNFDHSTHHHNATQNIDIHVDGSMDPSITAHMIASHVHRSNQDLVRDMRGATQ